ncbi:uncharacterized protein LOC133796004 [Humulus lupulus]|uniref:uncharacterized protein LOC133796004 n=1 Tax=Humulus lupulus TaxID=3486 RepID=UPI002B40E981|nr:uncharacterized protein LOC133796004 [Humulus lupulus]
MDRSAFMAMKYSIQSGHAILYDQHTKVQWSKYVWERCSIPKHRYILWLTLHQKLRTREYLSKHCQAMDIVCLLCGDHNGEISHLFFQCTYNKIYLVKMKEWIGCRAQTENYHTLLQWISKAKHLSKLRRDFYIAAVSALVYHIWRVRNDVLWSSKIWHVNHIIEVIKRELKLRLTVSMYKGKQNRDKDWTHKS